MPASLDIRPDDLSGDAIAELLAQHNADMRVHSPEESVHALDLAGLKSPQIQFFCGWSDGRLAGCGALKQLDDHHAEIKSMRTSDAFLRQGIAAQLLSHLLSVARTKGIRRVSLETGSMAAFVPARKLYLKFGFDYCGPFDQYVDDPNSVFMTRLL